MVATSAAAPALMAGPNASASLGSSTSVAGSSASRAASRPRPRGGASSARGRAGRSQRAGEDVYLSTGAVQHCRMAGMLQQAAVDERPDLVGNEIRLGVLVV